MNWVALGIETICTELMRCAIKNLSLGGPMKAKSKVKIVSTKEYMGGGGSSGGSSGCH